MKRAIVAAWLAWVCSACSANDAHAPGDAGADASADVSASDGGTSADAVAEDTGAFGAACDGVDPTNDPLVHETTGTGPAPVLGGGTIAEGSYHLVSATYYPVDGGTHTTPSTGLRSALRIRGTEARFAVLEETGVPNCAAFQFTTEGTTFTLLVAGQAVSASPYEATAMSLRIYGTDGVLGEYAKE